MPVIYDSIFEGSTRITRRDMCVLLNLDTSRTGLKFTHAEIKQAFKNRALRFHPDKQAGFTVPIPIATCAILMRDITSAKDHMLNGDDNIPGKAFLEARSESYPNNWTALIILVLEKINDNSSIMPILVRWLYSFSSSYRALLILSTFSEEQLNFRYINTYSDELAHLRPFLEQFDGNILTTILCGVKYLADNSDQGQFTASLNAFLTEYLGNNENNVALINVIKITLAKLKEILTDDFIERLQSVVNSYLADSLDKEQFTTSLQTLLTEGLGDDQDYIALINAIENTITELKAISTDNYIQQLQYVANFWSLYIATVPTWRQIIGVYFISLLFTATSLPRFFNALIAIMEVILEQKGVMYSILSTPLLLLVAAPLLPINIALQLTSSLFLIAINATYQLLVNGFNLASSLFNLFFLLLPNSNKTLSHQLFDLFESLVNITIRLSVTIILSSLDAVFFILTNKSPLSFMLDNINSALDSMLEFLTPLPQKHQEENAIALATNNHGPNLARERVTIAPEAATKPPRFFASRDLPTNQDDVFLNELLARISCEQMEPAAAQF